MKTKFLPILLFYLASCSIIGSCQSSEEKAKYKNELSESQKNVFNVYLALNNHVLRRLALVPSLVNSLKLYGNQTLARDLLNERAVELKQFESTNPVNSTRSENAHEAIKSPDWLDKFIKYVDSSSSAFLELENRIKNDGAAMKDANISELIAQLESTEDRITATLHSFDNVVRIHNEKFPKDKIDIAPVNRPMKKTESIKF